MGASNVIKLDFARVDGRKEEPMTESEIAQGILDYIRGEIACPGTEVTDQTELFESGILDSLMLLRLVMHLETTHSIAFTPEDLNPAIFGQVAALSSLVARRRGERV